MYGHVIVVCSLVLAYFTRYVSFPSTELLAVTSPMFYDVEYAYPAMLTRESRTSHLFDGSGHRARAQVSPDFQLSEFMAPMRR